MASEVGEDQSWTKILYRWGVWMDLMDKSTWNVGFIELVEDNWSIHHSIIPSIGCVLFGIGFVGIIYFIIKFTLNNHHLHNPIQNYDIDDYGVRGGRRIEDDEIMDHVNNDKKTNVNVISTSHGQHDHDHSNPSTNKREGESSGKLRLRRKPQKKNTKDTIIKKDRKDRKNEEEVDESNSSFNPFYHHHLHHPIVGLIFFPSAFLLYYLVIHTLSNLTLSHLHLNITSRMWIQVFELFL